MRQNFCEFIIKARHDKKLSQVDAAKEIGITQAQICNIEKGVYFPSVDTLIKMSYLYDITLDDLLGLKRKTRTTVEFGNIDSERRLLTLMDRYLHTNVILKLATTNLDEIKYDYLLSNIELFEYGKSIFEKNLDLLRACEKAYEDNLEKRDPKKGKDFINNLKKAEDDFDKSEDK